MWNFGDPSALTPGQLYVVGSELDRGCFGPVKVGGCIGSGATGWVYKVDLHGRAVAVKSFWKGNRDSENELVVLRRLQELEYSPGIIAELMFEGTVPVGILTMTVIPSLHHGLLHLIKNTNKIQQYLDILQFMIVDFLLVLIELQGRGIIPGDVFYDNVGINFDGKRPPEIKFLDVGSFYIDGYTEDESCREKFPALPLHYNKQFSKFANPSEKYISDPGYWHINEKHLCGSHLSFHKSMSDYTTALLSLYILLSLKTFKLKGIDAASLANSMTSSMWSDQWVTVPLAYVKKQLSPFDVDERLHSLLFNRMEASAELSKCLMPNL